MKLFFLGVDGGGTKTEFMIMDSQGKVLGFSRKDTCHYKQTSLENFEKIFKNGIEDLCKEAGINVFDIRYSVLGIPGYGEIEEDILGIQLIIKDILKTDRFQCVNDSLVGWAGSLGCKPGINIVAGTGTIGFGMNSIGRSARSGGWGHNCGDEGSAYWIGKRLIKLFTKQSDGRMEKTPLYNIVRENLNIKKDFDLISILLDDYKMERNKIARLSLLVYEAAEEGDLLAKEIFSQAAYEHFLMIKSLVKKLEFVEDKILVSYSGGVFKSGSYILSPLKGYLEEFDLGIQLVEPLLEPISGAVLYGFSKTVKDESKRLEIINKLQLFEDENQ